MTRMLNICCPNCGKILGLSGDGTNTQMICNRCKSEIYYRVENDTAHIQLVNAGKQKDQKDSKEKTA